MKIDGELFHCYLDIRRRDVSNHVEMVINDGERRYSFIIHDLERFTQRLVPTESRLASTVTGENERT